MRASLAERTPMPEVIVRSLANLQHEISDGNHTILADEPEGVGDDAGPDPYTLLLGALGACTSMTLLLYARRKQWPLAGVEVRLRHGRAHRRDCDECESASTRLDLIERRLALKGPLDDVQRKRLMEIAAMCPVHRTLTGEIHITDILKEEAQGE
jgi:putative redox protein